MLKITVNHWYFIMIETSLKAGNSKMINYKPQIHSTACGNICFLALPCRPDAKEPGIKQPVLGFKQVCHIIWSSTSNKFWFNDLKTYYRMYRYQLEYMQRNIWLHPYWCSPTQLHAKLCPWSNANTKNNFMCNTSTWGGCPVCNKVTSLCYKVTIIVSTDGSCGLSGVAALLLGRLGRAAWSHNWAGCRGTTAGGLVSGATCQFCWRLWFWGCLCPLEGILLQRVKDTI